MQRVGCVFICYMQKRESTPRGLSTSRFSRHVDGRTWILIPSLLRPFRFVILELCKKGKEIIMEWTTADFVLKTCRRKNDSVSGQNDSSPIYGMSGFSSRGLLKALWSDIKGNEASRRLGNVVHSSEWGGRSCPAAMNGQATREAFSGVIEKPQMTDQLLARPPFKFILDIHDFEKSELEAAANDKTTKTEFLDKLIRLLNDDGSLGSVSASKIIAGKEPEETNLLLQLLGNRARQAKADKKAKKEKTSSKEKDKTEDKEKKKSSSKSSSKDKDGEKKSRKKSSSKDDKKRDKSLRRMDSMIAVHGDNTPQDPGDDGYGEEEDEAEHYVNNDIEQEGNGIDSPGIRSGDSGVGDGDESPRPPPPEERAAALRPMTGAARPQTSMGRPGTAAARPAPPKIKKKQIATTDSTPLPVVELKAEIISEASKTNDAADNFLVQEDEEELFNGTVENVQETQVDEEERGALVQKIMEKKAELEEGAAIAANDDDDGDIDVERSKVTALQAKLQDVTKAAYPLARIFEYAHEDMESMLKEVEKWRSEARKNEVAEQNKESSGVGEATRLSHILNQLDQEIIDVKEALSSTKSRIMQNNERIKILVANI
ncbi:unnamed protein product [Caenorhabditis auriculariae]|uniref:Uncharacterized protein n=1 Tax=Caenorhabditis auriculariae TaxID=2777116 RepID=A0A8S1H1C0_9PELO|nr:unnamed protein product [Caenorhabditis auriculariae]